MVSRSTVVQQGASPVEPLYEPERWSLPQDFDMQSIERQARAYRAEMTVKFFAAIGRGLGWLWSKAVAAPVARWRERERTIRELSLLGERELADLGINRGLIPYVAEGKFHPYDDSASTGGLFANENLHPKRAA